MRHLFTIVVIGLLPMLATAQTYSQAPMLVVGGTQKDSSSAPANTAAPALAFPEAAVTLVGNPATSSKQAVEPQKPVDTTGASKTEESKLWPKNTVEIFMPPCIGMKPQLVQPCRCVITKLMSTMPHNEFLEKTQNNTIEQDARLTRIRTECATAPQRKK